MSDGVKIGFVGVGKMGLPICLRLRDAGFPVAVLPSPRSGDVLANELLAAGCSLAHSGAHLAADIDVLITCLPSSTDVETIVTGEQGVFHGLRIGQEILHVDHTSGDPRVSRELAARWFERGGRYIDAALSGTPEAAREGRLKLLCGGTPHLIERMRHVTNNYAHEIIAAGDTGSGHMLRLIGGLIGYGTALLTSEAFILAAAAGISPDSLRAMITGTGADSGTFQAIAAVESEAGSNRSPRQLSLASVLNNLDALLLQAHDLQCEVPASRAISDRFVELGNIAGTNIAISDLTHHLKTIS